MRFPKCLVVLFHRPLSREWFELAISTIEKYYRIIGPEEFNEKFDLKKPELLKGTCLITFDDGDLTVYDYAWPVLKSRGYKAILFVSPKVIRESKRYWFQTSKALDQVQLREKIFNGNLGRFKNQLIGISINSLLKSLPYRKIESILYELGGEEIEKEGNPNMSSQQLLELGNSGNFEIGAHTQNHPILANESDVEAYSEITDSVTELNGFLQRKIKFFAYPNGLEKVDFGEREFRILTEAGIEKAFSCRYTFVSVKDNSLAIPRMEISAGGRFKLTLKILLFPFIQETLERFRKSSGIKERKSIQNIFQNKSK